MDNKKFHKKNNFSFNSIPKSYKNSIDKSNHFLLRVKQDIIKKNQKSRQNNIKINLNNNLSTSVHKTPNLNLSKKDFFDLINDKNTNNTIYYSKKEHNPLIRFSNSVSKKNSSIHFSYFSSGHNFTPHKQLSSNIKANLLEKTIRPKTDLKFLTIPNMKRSTNNSTNKLKNQNDKKTSKKVIKIKYNNLFKTIKLQPKISLKIIDNKNFKNTKYEPKKYKTQKIKMIGKKIKYDLNTINDIESKKERLRNLLYGVSYMTSKKKCELCHKLVDNHTYKFHYFSHPSQILSWMYLGSFKNANNLEEIKTFGFKYILNCALEVKIKNIPKYIKYCHIYLTDSDTMDITKYFDQAFNFIESARKKGEKILIHCKLGISRSTAIIIGYLIKYMGYSTSSALEFLKSKRSSVHPNPGFISQLNLFEQKIKKTQRKSNLSNSTADFSISNNN